MLPRLSGSTEKKMNSYVVSETALCLNPYLVPRKVVVPSPVRNVSPPQVSISAARASCQFADGSGFVCACFVWGLSRGSHVETGGLVVMQNWGWVPGTDVVETAVVAEAGASVVATDDVPVVPAGSVLTGASVVEISDAPEFCCTSAWVCSDSFCPQPPAEHSRARAAAPDKSFLVFISQPPSYAYCSI